MDGDWVLIDGNMLSADRQHSKGVEDLCLPDATILVGPGERQCFRMSR